MKRKGQKCNVGSSITKRASWDNLPQDILEIVFKNLLIGDRVRVGAVNKHWNHVASQAKHIIPQIPEAPWQILLEDSYAFAEPFITQVGFKSLSENKIYRFNLPDDHHSQGWLCGSSHGWLVMASGDKFDPDMFLWNPLNGSTQNLPFLSTHPRYEDFVESLKEGDVYNVSCLFHRLQVFPLGSAGWVVAAIIHERFDDYVNQISFCTSQDERWTAYGDEEDDSYYIDIMFHEKKNSLFILTFGDSPKRIKDDLLLHETVHAFGCTLQLSFIFFDEGEDEGDNLSRDCYRLKRTKQVLRLVEDTIHDDGDVIVVANDIDRLVRIRKCGEREEHYRTRQVSLVPFSTSAAEMMTSIGINTIFCGSTSTNSIIVSGPLKGIETNCVYLAIDDCFGYCSDDERYSIREYGIYSLKTKQMRQSDRHTKVKCPSPSKIGWFEPTWLLSATQNNKEI